MAVALLTGCSEGVAPPHDAIATGDSADSRPEFTGPWAELFSSTYMEATSPAQRTALADGSVSEQEYAYFRQQIVICLAGIGVEATWKEGSVLDYSQPSSVTNEDIARCNKSGGLDIIALHDAVIRNPDNKDESEILVACLKRVRAVAPNYTADMLDAGTNLELFINTDKFAKCNVDPLHYGVK